eukprot:288142_1
MNSNNKIQHFDGDNLSESVRDINTSLKRLVNIKPTLILNEKLKLGYLAHAVKQFVMQRTNIYGNWSTWCTGKFLKPPKPHPQNNNNSNNNNNNNNNNGPEYYAYGCTHIRIQTSQFV